MSKKLGITYILALLFVAKFTPYILACSSSNEPKQEDKLTLAEKQRFGFEEEDDINKSFEETIFPNFGYTLRGYNVLIGNPFHVDTRGDPGFLNRIFKVDKIDRWTPDQRFKLPNGIEIYTKEICKLDSKTQVTSNEKDYQDYLMVNAGLKGPDLGFLSELLSLSFTLNTQYQKQKGIGPCINS